MSDTAIDKWKAKANAAMQRARSAKEVANEVGETFALAAEAGMAAAVAGYVQGKGGHELFGAVPVELAVGAAGLAIALATDSPFGTHAGRIGIGSMCAYLTTVGQGMGATAKAKASSTPPPPAK